MYNYIVQTEKVPAHTQVQNHSNSHLLSSSGRDHAPQWTTINSANY